MLQVITLLEAKQKIKAEIIPLQKTEIVPLLAAENRILAQDIVATENIPPAARSMVDGYAVSAIDTFGATEAIPAMLPCTDEIPMGKIPTKELVPDTCMKILTGGFLPNGANAAVMLENTDVLPDQTVCIRKPASPNMHIALCGDDVRKGECVMQKGTRLSTRAIGTLAALGISKIEVYRKVRVGIFSTGDELQDFDKPIQSGEIRDVNRAVLRAELYKENAELVDFGIVPDQKEKLQETIHQAASQCDIIFFTGSTSAGIHDYGEEVLKDTGRILWHGLSVKPGKPTLAARVQDALVFALPGHPAAAFLIYQILGRYALQQIQRTFHQQKTKMVTLAEPISANDGRELILPLRIENGMAYPIHSKSGLIRPLISAEGYTLIPRNCEGKHQNETILMTYFD